MSHLSMTNDRSGPPLALLEGVSTGVYGNVSVTFITSGQ